MLSHTLHYLRKSRIFGPRKDREKVTLERASQLLTPTRPSSICSVFGNTFSRDRGTPYFPGSFGPHWKTSTLATISGESPGPTKLFWPKAGTWHFQPARFLSFRLNSFENNGSAYTTRMCCNPLFVSVLARTDLSHVVDSILYTVGRLDNKIICLELIFPIFKQAIEKLFLEFCSHSKVGDQCWQRDQRVK